MYAIVFSAVGVFRPPVSAVAAGGAIIWALAWRRQERAVTAIEERDGARFYVDRTSPVQPIRLVRTPGFGGAFLRHPTTDQRFLRSFWNCFQVRVFATWSAVSHARRAVATP